MSNDITALRAHLFDAIAAVKSGQMDLQQARTISELSQTIINSAKIEVDFMRVTGADRATTFISSEEAPPALPDGIKGVTVHRMRG